MTYYEHFMTFWFHIYEYQVEDAKKNNDSKALYEIRNNIMKNVHLTDKEKSNILIKLKIVNYEDVYINTRRRLKTYKRFGNESNNI